MATDWFDGRIARRSGRTSSLGSLLDPVADKLLVLATLIVLIDQGVFPAWMVAAIVARELLISGLRQAAIERGVVIAARDLGKLKTWSQAIAAGVGGLAAAGAWGDRAAWWALLVALVLTWVSGLDYARVGAAGAARAARRDALADRSSRATPRAPPATTDRARTAAPRALLRCAAATGSGCSGDTSRSIAPRGVISRTSGRGDSSRIRPSRQRPRWTAHATARSASGR